MHELIGKLMLIVREKGIAAALGKSTHYLFGSRQRRDMRGEVLAQSSLEDRFTAIYSHNYWNTPESASGPGSTHEYTANLRRELPPLFAKHGIRRIFDAPCGDFNWMRHVIGEVALEYVGGDIVRPLVESNQAKYGSPMVSFIHVDLVRDRFPPADLMICRDCLFHLSVQDTTAVLVNFVESRIPLLLTTTHANLGDFVNTDIRTGDFRLIDLFASPYNFPTDTLARIEDWMPPDPQRLMCLWSREQVQTVLSSLEKPELS